MNRNNLFLTIATFGALLLASTSAVAVVDNADSLYVGPGETYTLGGAYSYNVSVVVAATGTLNVTDYNGGANTGYLGLHAPTITISGVIDGDQRGYRGRDGYNVPGEGPGGGGYPGGGGGYGGQGGASGWGNPGGPPYGTATEHDIQMGSGGAPQTLGIGGDGGAMVALYASSCTVSGQINVNGEQGSDVTGWGDGGGGGSGGGILIDATDVNVSGTLSANGGRGGNSVQRRGGGGGAGGRIKLFYCDLEFAGVHSELGGVGGIGGWPANGYAGDFGTYFSGLNSDPVVTAILDVANDQGRQVRITWGRSCLDDPEDENPVTHYTIWRRVDELTRKAAEPPGHARLAWPPGDWDFVLDVPARGEDQYNAVVPTLADSNVAGMHWSVFFISGVTADPFVFYDSVPDSGYSVDNLAPGVPPGFMVAYGVENQLTWLESEDADFQYFKIYRGESEDFVPAPDNQVHTTVVTEWVDSDAAWGYYYKISAVDHNGNESIPAPPETVTGLGGQPVPGAFKLDQNVPNPFNPATVIRFNVAHATRVKLSVYNAKGQLVRVLLDEELAKGVQEVKWDGRNSFGQDLASGAYFYRLESRDFVESRKMTLLR